MNRNKNEYIQHRKWSSLSFPTKHQNKNFGTAVEPDLTTRSSSKLYAWDCCVWNLVKVWIPNLYKTFLTFQRLFTWPNMIHGLGVMQFWSWPDCWNSGLIRFEQSENFELLSPVQAQSQKTSSTKIVVNFINFPFITHMLKSDKQRKSYDRWNTVHKWKNLEYIFWFVPTTISQNPANWIWCSIRRNAQYKSDGKF
jgi:hypothetical protein